LSDILRTIVMLAVLLDTVWIHESTFSVCELHSSCSQVL